MSRNNLPPMRLYADHMELGLSNYIDSFVYKLLDNYNKFNKNLEIDVIQFQKRINKLCKKYHLTEITAKRAFKRLVKLGLVEIVYTLGFGKYVVKVKLFDDLLDRDDASKTDVIAEKSPEERNPEQIEKRSIEQQQQVRDHQKQTEVDQLLRANGFNYHKRYLPLLAGYGIEKIKDSIEYFKESSLTNVISNSHGWLRQCLRFEWYVNKDEHHPMILFEKLTYLANKVLDEFGTLPSNLFDAMWSNQPKDLDQLMLDWKNKPT